MDFLAILLSVTVSSSKKSGNPAYYVSVSYKGKAKRLYMREMPEGLQLVPDSMNPKLLLPRGGTMPVKVSYDLGGYGEALGVDVLKIEKA